MRPLLIVAILLCCGLAQAEEIKLPKQPQYAQSNFSAPVTFNSLADVPHDFAKNFPPELYYWWAKMHNAREYDELPQPRRSTTRITTRGTQSATVTGSPRFDWSNGGRRINANHSQQTFIQEFREPVGVGPATIYNPYYR